MTVLETPIRRAAPRVLLATLLGTFAAGSGVGLLATSAWLLARAAERPPVLYLMVAIVAVRTFGIGKGVFRYAERLLGHDAALRMLGDVRIAVYRRCERLFPGSARLLGGPAMRTGDVIARVVADTESVVDLTVRVFVPATGALVVALAAIGLTYTVLPVGAVLLAASVLVTGVALPAVVARAGGRAQVRIAPARGDMAAAVVESLAAADELRVYGVAVAGVDAVMAADADLAAGARSGIRTDAFAGLITTLVVGLTVVGELLLGASAVASGRLAGVELGVLVLLPLAVHEVVSSVTPAVTRWQQVRTSLRRLDELDRLPDPVADPAEPRSLAAPEWTPPRGGLGVSRGDAPTRTRPHTVSLRNVSARWPATGPGIDLAGIDLELGAGRRIGVVGRSGSGKSTLASVLVRFLDTTGGHYRLDGHDVAEFTGDDVRGVIGLLTQDAHIFDTTITENLRPADPDATADQMRAVLSRVGLGDWLHTLPKGLATPLGEHGATLSGGERQRLALARLLLARHQVLVFDEPAEHLDPLAAAALTADLLRESDDRSVLLITHAHDGLDACDEVIVLDGGRIVDRGTYYDLVSRPGPFTDVMGPAPIPETVSV
jgi:thiol reductant ABC exporter CydC subunit